MPDADSVQTGQAMAQFPVLKPSIPQRRDGYRTLANIPAEIYLEIFEYFSTKHWDTRYEHKWILSNLIPVCRLFRVVLLPRYLWSLSIRPEQRNLVKFATETFDAATEDNLFALPRSISFSGWIYSILPILPRDEEPDEETRILSQSMGILPKIALSLPQFVNVQQLTFSGVPISPLFFAMVSEMKSLHAVHIMNSKFEVPSEQDGPLMQAEYSAATPWTDLAIDNAEGSALYVPWIASLAASPALTYLRSYSPIAQAILSGPFEFQKLKILHARGCHDWLGLGAVLNSTPGVTSLTISQAAPFPTTADGRILRLASDALPNLETLHCPSALVGELLIGRPVHDLHVERTGTVNPWDVDEEGMQQMYTEHIPDADVVGLLARSGAPIRRLHISALAFQKLRLEFGYDDAVADHIEGLKHLEKLSFNPMDDMVDVLAPSSRPINSHVKTVCARLSKTSGELDLQKEHMLVTQYFALAYPHATKFAFTSHIKWHLHEQRGEPTWIPAVKSSLKDVLRARIMRLGEKGETVTDIRGFLKGLFTEEELTSPQLRHTLGLEEE